MASCNGEWGGKTSWYVFLWERTRLVNNERRLLGGLEFLDSEQFSQTPKTVYIFIQVAFLPSVVIIVSFSPALRVSRPGQSLCGSL